VQISEGLAVAKVFVNILLHWVYRRI